MNFEQNTRPESKNQELKKVNLTKKEFDLLRDVSKNNDPEKLKLMEEHGIEFDGEDLIVDIEGKKYIMTTQKNDIGTIFTEETIIEKHGEEILKKLAA